MADTPTLRTPETQVNTTDAAVGAGGNATQEDGQIVALGDGGYVVVWTDGSRAFNPSGTAVLGQRYDPAGNRAGGEFNISQFVVGDQSASAVTAMPDGGFLVAFVDSANNGDIYVRRYDVDLNLLRTDTIDNTAATTVQPAVTAFDDGSYVVAYTVGAANTDVVGRLVSPAGVVGSEFTIHADSGASDEAELATLSDGNFVVVFREDDDAHPQEDAVRFRVLEPDGTPVTAATRVFGGAAQESDPDVAALPDGRFVIVHRDDDVFTDDDAAVATIRANDGSFVTSFDVREGANNDPNVVVLADGGFLVTFERIFLNDVQGQRYDAAGNEVGSLFLVRNGANNSTVSTAQAALLQDGRIALAINAVSGGDADIAHSIWGATIDVADLDGVLWRHVDGTVATRDIELGSAPNTWEIESTGDFDADGDSDILWRHEDGQVVTWELQGGQFVTNHSIEFAATTWSIAATGDVDGDGDDDIIWRHQDGAVVTWELQDGEFVQAHSIESAATTWSIAGAGDFDGDGDDDILWRHEEGAVVTWEMEDGEFVQSHSIAFASPNWRIEGTGDFDGDGDDDIVWHHRDGAVVTWEMQDGDLAQVHSIADAAGDWRIAGVQDFNGDGNADLLWRHAEGSVVTWELDGGDLLAVNNLGVVAETWQIRGTGEFDLA